MRNFRSVLPLLLFFLLVLSGCSRKRIDRTEDIRSGRIAVFKDALGQSGLDSLFKDAVITDFSKPVDFVLAVTSGKCDAGVIDTAYTDDFLNVSTRLALLGNDVPSDSPVSIIVLRSRIEGGDSYNGKHIYTDTVERFHKSIISKGYWLLLAKGLYVTLIIFIFALAIAFILSSLLVWMSYRPALKKVVGPVLGFINTIHDVPSIVLIFFFYYVVFASSQVDGILVCIIALGIYSTGSFTKIFKTSLEQIDILQHQAAEMLGLRGWKKYRLVILPQAIKTMLPFLGSESKALLRATTYAGYISQFDLVKVTEIIRNQTYDAFIPLLVVSIIFLAISHLITAGYGLLYKKLFTNA